MTVDNSTCYSINLKDGTILTYCNVTNLWTPSVTKTDGYIAGTLIFIIAFIMIIGRYCQQRIQRCSSCSYITAMERKLITNMLKDNLTLHRIGLLRARSALVLLNILQVSLTIFPDFTFSIQSDKFSLNIEVNCFKRKAFILSYNSYHQSRRRLQKIVEL